MGSGQVRVARIRVTIALAGALTGAVYGGLCATLVAAPRGAVLRVATVSGAALLGVIVAYLSARLVGRRLQGVAAALLVVAGGVLTPLAAPIHWPGLLGPALAGLGAGVLTIVAPLLARELAANSRHQVAGSTGFGLPLGLGATQLVAVAAVAVELPVERLVWPTIGALALLVGILLATLPESPVWLATHRTMERSYAAMVRLFGTLEASIELDWVLMARDMAAEERRLRWRDLRLPGMKRTVTAGAVLALVREAPLGLAALVLVPAVAGELASPRAATVALLVLGLTATGVGVTTALHRFRGFGFARLIAGLALALVGLSLMTLATHVHGGGALVLVLVATPALAVAQFVLVTPAARGSVEPLVPPWLVRAHTTSTHVLAAAARVICLTAPAALVATRGPATTAMVATLVEIVVLIVLTAALPQALHRTA
ncbi:Hypothetical protein PFCIRM119_07405 [Propionibacterium freudenreichii]|uniref:MFS transporter n=1 Tax=Propionibacterium freudenreichii TaxID=1744 RepID=UPI000541E4C3|nr:MFS transporter [Propionibacterium freudenreichii]MCT3017296.1 hypothetical protein [Propionibacterium freudenreichii]CEG88401.1 Hypothetical protein PFCIRM119_07405 [Propionibacterium freudenreichii]